MERTTVPIRILRLQFMLRMTGLSKSGAYAKLTKNPRRPELYDETFPRPLRLSARSVGWIESEIVIWLETQAKRRDSVSK